MLVLPMRDGRGAEITETDSEICKGFFQNLLLLRESVVNLW